MDPPIYRGDAAEISVEILRNNKYICNYSDLIAKYKNQIKLIKSIEDITLKIINWAIENRLAYFGDGHRGSRIVRVDSLRQFLFT